APAVSLQHILHGGEDLPPAGQELPLLFRQDKGKQVVNFSRLLLLTGAQPGAEQQAQQQRHPLAYHLFLSQCSSSLLPTACGKVPTKLYRTFSQNSIATFTKSYKINLLFHTIKRACPLAGSPVSDGFTPTPLPACPPPDKRFSPGPWGRTRSS